MAPCQRAIRSIEWPGADVNRDGTVAVCETHDSIDAPAALVHSPSRIDDRDIRDHSRPNSWRVGVPAALVASRRDRRRRRRADTLTDWRAERAVRSLPVGLRLRGDLYGRTVPTASLQLDQARPVDLTRDRDLQPVSRSIGTALPGYRSGWFSLRNGQRALLYVTDPSRVALVPTRDRYVILLSVADPAAFIASLRRAQQKP